MPTLPKCINMWQLYLESWAIPREKVQRKQWNQEVILSTETAGDCSRPSWNLQTHWAYQAAKRSKSFWQTDELRKVVLKMQIILKWLPANIFQYNMLLYSIVYTGNSIYRSSSLGSVLGPRLIYRLARLSDDIGQSQGYRYLYVVHQY